MSTIDRVRYYDGEFLRAFDFDDEQTYHLEMRRRLNRYLHLDGIAQGLELSEDIQGLVHQVSIQPGMAIDAFGREIYVFAPYTLGDADIAAIRSSKAINYDVWLRYKKIPSTPPSSGYAACNQPNEYTRWIESFDVVLLESPSTPVAEPGFADDDADNPAQDGVAVLLGKVFVDPSSATQQFSSPNPAPDNRLKYVGVIAQRIKAPIPYDVAQANPPYAFLQQNTSLNPPVSLEIEPNIFADRNLIVGPDFDLTKLVNPISPQPGKNAAGSVKIASDLFVQGNIFSNIPDKSNNPQYFGINDYVKQILQQFLPEFRFVQQQVLVSTVLQSAGLVGRTEQIPVKTARLTNVTSSLAVAYVSEVHFTQPEFVAQFTGVGGAVLQLQVTTPPKANFTPNNQNGTVSVTWQAGPAAGAALPTQCPIQSFTLSCLVICFP